MKSDRTNPLTHAAIYLLARGLPGIVAFLAIPLFTRLLEPAEYGQYALIIAAVSVCNALCFQWLRLSLLRYLPAHSDDPTPLKSTLAAATALLIAGLAVIAAGLCLLPGMQEMQLIILACWTLLAVQALYELCCEYARGNLQPWRYMVMQMARAVTGIGVGIALVILGWGWAGPIAGLAVGMGLAVIYAISGDWRDVRPRIDRAILRKVALYGMPLSLTVALAVVIGTSDRFLINWFMGPEATGLYAVAFDFTAQTLTLLMLAINMAVFPIAVRAFERQGPQACRDQMRTNAGMLLGLGAPAAVGLAVLAPGIAWCFLGENFRGTALTVIPLIAVGAFLESLKAFHFDAAFQFAHRTIIQVWIVLLVAMVNIGLNVIAIPKWGIHGAAATSVAAYGLSIGLTIWIGRRHFAVPFPLKFAIQALFAAAAMGTVLYPFRDRLGPWPLAWQVAMGAAVYGGLLLAMNYMGLRDAVMRTLRDRKHTDAGIGSPRLIETQ